MAQQAIATHALLARASKNDDDDGDLNVSEDSTATGARGARAMHRDRMGRTNHPGKLAVDVRELIRQQVTSDPLCMDARARNL